MRALILVTLLSTLAGSSMAQTNAAAPSYKNPAKNVPKRSDFQDKPEAYGPAFTEWSKTRKAPIEQLQGSKLADGTELTADQVRQRIADTVGKLGTAKPKKAR